MRGETPGIEADEVVMKTQVLTGSKAEIAERLTQIDGDVVEVVVLLREPTDSEVPATVDELFAEMKPFEADAGGIDYSREAIYTRMPGE
jgi:hypothetical protein